MEGELWKILDDIFALMDKQLIPSPITDESKVSYYKMKGDCYRYLAEFATDDAKSKAGEVACVACAEATMITVKDLVVTHPVRLALNSSVFQSEVLQNPDESRASTSQEVCTSSRRILMKTCLSTRMIRLRTQRFSRG